jgi:hypothetical protein
MHRVDNSTAVPAIPVPAAVGPNPNHYFTKGNPGAGIPATIVDDDWANAIQEEIAYVIEQNGIVLDKTSRTQLKTAIQRMIDGGDFKPSVKVASTAAINLAAPGANIDGIAMVAGDRFLEKDHGTPALRGIYIWNGAAAAATRAIDFDENAEVTSGAKITVEQGTVNADTTWMLTTDGVIVLGATGLNFANVSGITQAAADARYMGIGYLLVQDQKASGTNGGSSLAATQQRTLNTVVSNTISGASLATNQITLPAGTYRVNGYSLNASGVFAQTWLRNVTDASIVALGGSCAGYNVNIYPSMPSSFTGRFTIAATKVFDVQHFSSAAIASIGLGRAVTSGNVEIFSSIEIYKEA